MTIKKESPTKLSFFIVANETEKAFYRIINALGMRVSLSENLGPPIQLSC